MDSKEWTGTLKLITPKVVEEVMKSRNMTQNEAVKLFYLSETYSLLEKENSKMWHFSPIALCDIFERELDGKELAIPEV